MISATKRAMFLGGSLALGWAVGCSSSSGSDDSEAASCQTLQACCSKIADPTLATSCTSTLKNDESLTDSDQTCTGSLVDFVSYCETGDGGSGSPPGTDGGAGADTGTGDAAMALSLGFTPSNVDLQGIAGTLPAVEIMTTDCTIDSGCGGGISCADNATIKKTIVQNANNVTICVYYVSSFKIDSAAVLKATGTNPVAIVSLGTIDIEGQLLVDATGGHPVAGGSVTDQGGPSNVGGGQGGSGADEGTGMQGGSGAGYCGVGGAGGVQHAGQTAKPGGIAWGTPQIVPLAGGAGGGDNASSGGLGGGGGALQLVAKTSITVGSAGIINAGGGGGEGASNNDDTVGTGGGGGSGGSILLESPTVMVAGILAANGGGGGGVGVYPTATEPPTSDATASATAAPGGSGGGGAGSAGATTAGSAGGYSPVNAGQAFAGQPPGGGGGAGRIRINTTSGSATISGTVSPSMGTCSTQGTL
jgi:hypothetical protein